LALTHAQDLIQLELSHVVAVGIRAGLLMSNDHIEGGL
jgi:hypothetical protein